MTPLLSGCSEASKRIHQFTCFEVLQVAFALLDRWSPLPFQREAAAAFGEEATPAFS
jgi:hypothetical protein